MTKEEIDSKIKELKRGFRLVMNGPASQSMREKGLDYRLNWGVPFMQLKQMAADLPHDYDLAIALWKEDIRECKILATLLMPHDKMPEEVAEIWMEQTHSQEMAEMQAFNLYQYVSYAPKLAYRWMALDDTVKEICAYDILGRLFMKGQELKSPSAGLRHAAMNALTRFADLGLVFERLAKAALKREGFDLL